MCSGVGQGNQSPDFSLDDGADDYAGDHTDHGTLETGADHVVEVKRLLGATVYGLCVPELVPKPKADSGHQARPQPDDRAFGDAAAGTAADALLDRRDFVAHD